MATLKSTRPPRRINDLAGKRFGRLLVLQINGVVKGKAHWRCRCDCGATAIVNRGSLLNGYTRSCGCLYRELRAVYGTIHGHSATAEYGIWEHIIQRCCNPKFEQYDDYGGRGIEIVEEWRHDFMAFLSHVGLRPSARHSIDRYPNNDGNYEPGNVRWATRLQQNRNSRHVHWVTFEGLTLAISEWAERSQMPANAIHYRLRAGWSIEQTLTIPIGKRRKRIQ